MKKAVFGIMLTLLLTGILTVAFNIKLAKSEWTGTVYIRADGSIDPPDAPIKTYDCVTYTLTDDITSSSNGIVVERDNIIIDGTGHTLRGKVAYELSGVYLSGRSNVTVKNTSITNFDYGIRLIYSLNNMVSGNIITANRLFGIWLNSSSNNIVSGNDIANNKGGILLVNASNNIVDGNDIANNYYGIRLIYSSNNNIVSGNIITANYEFGIRLAASSNNNIVSGNIITANYEYGIRLAASSNNNIVSGNIITANYEYGIWFGYALNNIVSGNNIINNEYGIGLEFRSKNNDIYHNNFINNRRQNIGIGDVNFFDNGYPSGGNYWSDYTDVDAYSGPNQDEPKSDGIGDTPYTIDMNNIDRYPLKGPFRSFNPRHAYAVEIVSNSTIMDFQYFESNRTITMHASNMTRDQTFGFCRLTIPRELLPPPYTITVNDTKVQYEPIFENQTLSIIYFTYEHSTIEITVIPEFPLTTIIFLFIGLLSTTITLRTKKKTKP